MLATLASFDDGREDSVGNIRWRTCHNELYEGGVYKSLGILLVNELSFNWLIDVKDSHIFVTSMISGLSNFFVFVIFSSL